MQQTDHSDFYSLLGHKEVIITLLLYLPVRLYAPRLAPTESPNLPKRLKTQTHEYLCDATHPLWFKLAFKRERWPMIEPIRFVVRAIRTVRVV